MTDNEIRIVIAEKCGRNGWWCPQCKTLVPECTLGYQNRHLNCCESAREMPNYLNDLNVMREVVLTLNNGDRANFAGHIHRITLLQGKTGIDGQFAAINCTARQRAEAFCRTLGIWKD